MQVSKESVPNLNLVHASEKHLYLYHSCLDTFLRYVRFLRALCRYLPLYDLGVSTYIRYPDTHSTHYLWYLTTVHTIHT